MSYCCVASTCENALQMPFKCPSESTKQVSLGIPNETRLAGLLERACDGGKGVIGV